MVVARTPVRQHTAGCTDECADGTLTIFVFNGSPVTGGATIFGDMVSGMRLVLSVRIYRSTVLVGVDTRFWGLSGIGPAAHPSPLSIWRSVWVHCHSLYSVCGFIGRMNWEKTKRRFTPMKARTTHAPASTSVLCCPPPHDRCRDVMCV